MVVILRTKSGKEFSETVNRIIDLEEAREVYENDLVKVIDVQEEKYGDHTNTDAFNIIENEGVGYAVQHYISWKEFKDPETRRLWKLADETLCQLEEYVGVK